MRRSLSEFAAAMNGLLIGPDATFSNVSTDSRTCEFGDLFVALIGDRFDGHDFIADVAGKGVAAVVVSRQSEVAIPQIVVKDTLIALQLAAAAWRRAFEIPVVGVAGSNGKTTTKEMIATIFAQLGPCLSTKGTLNNHIGVPLTLLGLTSEHKTAVIEIGANHPGEVAALTQIAAPTIGVVTNAGAEHLEGFGSLEGAARAEGEMFAGLSADATAVINADDPYAALWASMNRAGRMISFGLDADADCSGSILDIAASNLAKGQSFRLNLPEGQADIHLSLLGRHNVLNAIAASAVAYAVGCPLTHVVAGLTEVRPVKGRLEIKKAINGGYIIDDSYNANPSSLQAGLDVLAAANGEKWLVLGDMAELGDETLSAHQDAGRLARACGAKRLFTLGNFAAEAAITFGKGAEKFSDSQALAERLASQTSSEITILVKGSRVNRLERVVDFLIRDSITGS